MKTMSEVLARYPGAVTFTYGDTAALNAEILALVRAGRKSVTCSAWSACGEGGEPLPVPGRVDVALDWSGRPALAVRTLSVEKIRFCDVKERHVPPQGEFRDLAEWQAGYRAYLTRAGQFDAESDMMMETFEMVEDFA